MLGLFFKLGEDLDGFGPGGVFPLCEIADGFDFEPTKKKEELEREEMKREEKKTDFSNISSCCGPIPLNEEGGESRISWIDLARCSLSRILSRLACQKEDKK